MTAVIPMPDPSPEWDNLAAQVNALTTPQLFEAARQDMADLVAKTMRLALIIRALEDRGEKVEFLPPGMLRHLRRVAYHQMLPEVVAHFAGTPSLITAVGNLPLPDQRRLASGEKVILLVPGPDGQLTKRLADPQEMRAEQVAQVFGRDYMRSEAEQALFLDQKRQKATVRGPEQVGPLKLDYERGGVVVGRTFVSLAEIDAAAKALRK